MQLTRILAPILLVASAIACSGGSGGGTFSVLDGVYDDAPAHGYESPTGRPTSGSSGSSGSSGRDGGGQPGQPGQPDSGSGSRPVACGTVLSCTGGATVTYDCSLFRSDGRIVSSQGTEQGTWTASGTTITIVLKGGDGGTATQLQCTPKSASSGADAGKDTGVPPEGI